MYEVPPKVLKSQQEAAPQYSRGEMEDQLDPQIEAVIVESKEKKRLASKRRGKGGTPTAGESHANEDAADETLQAEDDAVPTAEVINLQAYKEALEHSDPRAESAAPENAEGPSSKAEYIASLRSMVTEYQRRIQSDPNVKWDAENSHDALHKKITATEKKLMDVEKGPSEATTSRRMNVADLDQVRKNLGLENAHEVTPASEVPFMVPEVANDNEKPEPASEATQETKEEITYGKATKGLNLEGKYGEELAPRSAEEISKDADARYFQAYKEAHQKKNSIAGVTIERADLKKLEKNMLEARARSLKEREMQITDPAERARLRLDNALSIAEFQRTTRIEGMKQEGRWDQKLFDSTLGKYGAWQKGLEEKHGALKVRAVRAAITTMVFTGGAAVALALGPAASVTAFGVIGGYGAIRFARSVVRSPVGKFFGNVYKNTIGEKQRSKSEGRLNKLEVKGELDEKTYTEFFNRFKKNYNRSDTATLNKKIGWVAAVTGVAITGAVGYEALHEIHEHVGHGGGGGGTHHGGSGKAAAGHGAAHPAGNHEQHAATKPVAEKHPTEELSIHGKINDADRLVGHFAEKLQKDFPDPTKAPASVQAFLKEFHVKPGESIVHGEDRAAETFGLKAHHLSSVMHEGDTIKLNSEGQIVIDWADKGPAHVLFDPYGTPPISMDDLEKHFSHHGHHTADTHHATHPAKSHEKEAGPVQSTAAESTAQTQETGAESGTPYAHSTGEAFKVSPWHAEHETLVSEHASLQSEYDSLPKYGEPNYDQSVKDYTDHLDAYTNHLNSYNKHFETGTTVTESPEAPPANVPTESPVSIPTATPSHEDVAPATQPTHEESASAAAESVSQEVIKNSHGVSVNLGETNMYAWKPLGVNDGSTGTYRIFDGMTQEARRQAGIAYLEKNSNVDYVFLADPDPVTGKIIPHMLSRTPQGYAQDFTSPALNPVTDKFLPPVDRNDYIEYK